MQREMTKGQKDNLLIFNILSILAAAFAVFTTASLVFFFTKNVQVALISGTGAVFLSAIAYALGRKLLLSEK